MLLGLLTMFTLVTAPMASALPFEGVNAWRSPCLLDAAGINVDPLGRVGCFGPVDARQMLGRPFTFRFGARRKVVTSEGWSRYTRAIGYLNEHGERGLPILTTEGLADDRRPSLTFCRYARDAIVRLNTPLFEIANEPNGPTGSEFGQDPRAFGQRLCDAYRGWQDAGSPGQVTLMTGGLSTESRRAALDYLGHTKHQVDRSCGVGAWSRFSAVGVHVYADTPWEAAGTVITLHAWLHHHGFGRLTIAVDEYAWGSVPYGERLQRDNQVEFQRWAYASRHRCGISAAYWFASRDLIEPPPNLNKFGLTRIDNSPKPVFRSWVAFLGDHGIAGDGIPRPAVTPCRLHLSAHSRGRACRREHPR